MIGVGFEGAMESVSAGIDGSTGGVDAAVVVVEETLSGGVVMLVDARLQPATLSTIVMHNKTIFVRFILSPRFVRILGKGDDTRRAATCYTCGGDDLMPTNYACIYVLIYMRQTHMP